MINEAKIIFDKIKTLRLLKEAVGQGDIINAINNRKIIHMFYAGENTQNKGYRTIQPHVLGISKTGNVILRAWQEAGDSDSFRGKDRTPRRDHEYFVTNSMKPGWRLFRLDGIKSFSPTGKNFEVTADKQRPLYNPNDRGMTSIIASADPAVPVTVRDTGTVNKSDEDMKNIVTDLYRIASRYLKEKVGNKIVVFKNNDFYTDFEKNRNKYKPEQVIGNLKDLYTKYVGTTRNLLPKDWQKNKINKAKNDLVRSMNKKNTQPIK